MRRSVPRGRVLAALVIGAETTALFFAYYTLGLRDRVLSLEQSSIVQTSVLQVLVTVRGVLPLWLLQSLSTFTSTIGLTPALRGVVLVTRSLGSNSGFSAVGGAIVAPAYFAVRRMLRPLPQVAARSRPTLHGRVRPAKAHTQAPGSPIPTAVA